MLYRDKMDPSRTVSPAPTAEEPDRCRVYFDGRFAGMASVPTQLFGVAAEYGFKLVPEIDPKDAPSLKAKKG